MVCIMRCHRAMHADDRGLEVATLMCGPFVPAWPDRRAEDEGGVRAGAIVGTCEEMCPAPERERRSRLSDIQVRPGSLFVDV